MLQISNLTFTSALILSTRKISSTNNIPRYLILNSWFKKKKQKTWKKEHLVRYNKINKISYRCCDLLRRSQLYFLSDMNSPSDECSTSIPKNIRCYQDSTSETHNISNFFTVQITSSIKLSIYISTVAMLFIIITQEST